MSWGAASLSGAGLFAGAAAWGLHQQVGIIVASWSCGSKAAPGIWFTGVVALVILVVGAVLSVPALQGGQASQPARTRHFVALVSVMAAALFFFALALQGVAALFLPGCEG